jgi:tetratricopeptide (TPR) repeat protein
LHSDIPPALEAQLRLGLAELCLNTSAVKAAHAELERAAALYRSLGDLPCLGGTLSRMAFSLLELGRTEEAQQALAEAQRLLEHTGWTRTLITAHSVQVSIETYLGRGNAARTAGEKALRLCELVGADRSALVITCNLVETFLEVGDIDGAIAAGRDLAVRLRETSNSPLLGSVLGILACALTAGGNLGEALTMAREAAPLLRDHGRLFWLFDHLALRAELVGRTRDAARIAGFADASYRTSGHPREPIGRRAVERLATLLREALPADEIAQLHREGTRLTEDQAISLALRG